VIADTRPESWLGRDKFNNIVALLADKRERVYIAIDINAELSVSIEKWLCAKSPARDVTAPEVDS